MFVCYDEALPFREISIVSSFVGSFVALCTVYLSAQLVSLLVELIICSLRFLSGLSSDDVCLRQETMSYELQAASLVLLHVHQLVSVHSCSVFTASLWRLAMVCSLY